MKYNFKLNFALSFVLLSSLPAFSEEAPSYSLLYSYTEATKRSLYISDENGENSLKIGNFTLSDGYPAISPNGKHIAFYGKYDKYKTWSIHTVDLDGNNFKRLTQVKNVWDSSPVWSPDGKLIVFAREYKDQNGIWQEEIWRMNPDGSNKKQIKGLKGRSPEFMKDGRLLFQTKASPSQISIANLDGSNQIVLTNDATNNMSPKISPDGSKIAYISSRDGNQEVYIMNLDGSNQKRMTRNSIDEWGPSWSTDGTRVLFSSENVYDSLDIFSVNIDDALIQEVLRKGSQLSTMYHVDSKYLKRLMNKNKQSKK
ncbi:TolB family protein [Pseudoalteromonas spongiae]|uniref:TolB family protein n=1 Tax=Pseudoalteromonas spongiae TaxID=298657 RepID=UPI00373700E7